MSSLPAPSSQSAVFDLIIIGGGIMGAWVARDAAARGMRVVLFEQGDIASGTSSRTSKLVHGGLRYLEQGAFGLVAESQRERAVWLRIAPHLVRPLPFLFPIYRGARPSRWKVRLGMVLYDALALFRNVEPHQMLSADETRRLEPALRAEGLVGAARFFDAQMDDARLCLEVVLAARGDGARVETYTAVDGLIVRDGRVAGARIGSRKVFGSVVVNAAGPWLDRVREMADDRSQRLRPTRGSHLVLPPLLRGHALVLSAQRDGRTFFVLPWQGLTLIGTTDLDYPGDPASVTCTDAERAYLLEEARRVLPDAAVEPRAVLAEFAGVRPLVSADGASASAVARGDLIEEGPNGLISIAGGKFTTARAVAERVVDLAGKRLGSSRFRECRTATTPLEGGRRVSVDERAAWTARATALGLDAAQVEALSRTYGARLGALIELASERGAERLHPGLPWIIAQVDFAVEQEMARTVDDVLRRRLPIALGPHRRDPEVIRRVAERMGVLLGWDSAAKRDHLERYLAA